MKQANEAVKLAQSKYSKLASENAALKGMHHYSGLSPKHSKDAMMDMKRPFIDELIYSAEYYSVCGHISASLNRAISAVHGDYSWLPETPATDAYLDEVLACGVDLAACALDGVNQFNYANMLDELAQKIRKGAAL
ncbi:hypothetical protein C0V48_001405 [Salmonella enterica]|nr:hypothetical protein [Salmonella enterica]